MGEGASFTRTHFALSVFSVFLRVSVVTEFSRMNELLGRAR